MIWCDFDQAGAVFIFPLCKLFRSSVLTNIRTQDLERVRHNAGHHKIRRVSCPQVKKLWKSIQNKDLPKSFRGYLWKTLHNAHKIGSYWENIPDWEHRCEPNATDSLKHIMLECEADLIWPLAKEMWELRNPGTWPNMIVRLRELQDTGREAQAQAQRS